MSKGGVPEWFGKDEKPGAKRRSPVSTEPAAPEGGGRERGAASAGGKPPPRQQALVGAAVAVLAIAGAGAFFAMRTQQGVRDDAARELADRAQRERLLEAMKQSAAEPAEEVPDPSELPSIDEVIAEDEAEADETDHADEMEAADAAPQARDSASVLQITRALNPEFRRCYEQELRLKPNAKGRADVTLTIAPEGRVTKIVVKLQGDLSDSVSSCVSGAFKKAQFEPAAEEATVKLPILLQH